MKLSVENIGKVLNATVKLNGLTVIAGGNGAGKSTLGRCLMTYVSVMRQLEAHVRNRKIQKFVDVLVAAAELSDYSGRYIARYLRCFNEKNLMSESEWDTSEKIKKNIISAVKVFYESSLVKSRLETVDFDVASIAAHLREINAESSGGYIPAILEECFRQAFCNQINPLSVPSAVGSVSVFDDDAEKDSCAIRFESNRIVGLPDRYTLNFAPAIYVEPIHVLDMSGNRRFTWETQDPTERCGAGSYTMDRILSNRNYVAFSQETQEDETVTALMLEMIDIIRGGLEDRDDELVFKEKFDDAHSAFVELANLASGSKTMAVILQALKNHSLRKNQLLIIDEPESNLHPEWQIKFAHVLVMLYKRLSIRVVLNTHSPYFLKAIEYYAEKEGVSSADVNYYLMKKSDGDVLYTAEECTGNTSLIFQTMYAPFAEIM